MIALFREHVYRLDPDLERSIVAVYSRGGTCWMEVQPRDPDRLSSLRQLAQLIGKDESRLRRRAAAGRLDAELVGGSYVTILRRLVDSWERRGTRGRMPDSLPAYTYAVAGRKQPAE